MSLTKSLLGWLPLGFTLAALPSAVMAQAQIAEPSATLPEDNYPSSEAEAKAAGALPSLPALFALALQHDAQLSSQRYDMEATAQQIPKARAGLLPQVDASIGYVYQDSENYYTGNPAYDPSNERIDPEYEARYLGQTEDTTWQVQLTQPLFSLERWRQLDKAYAQRDAAELQVAVAERDLALQLSEAYLDAFLASRKLGLLASKREALELQVKQAQRAFDLGIGDRINLYESQARFDQALAEQIRAENELDNALSDLERLTGQLPRFDTSTLGDLSEFEVPSDWGEPQTWLERTQQNVEVLLAKQQQQIAQEDTDVRRAGHYPELNLNLSYVDRGSNDPFRESENASASVELNVPIYRGGYTSANVRQGELTALSSAAAYTNTLNLAQQEVRTRLRSLNGDVRQLEALKRSIESSRLFLQAAEKGEQLGLRDLVDVLDARADLYDLRIQFVEVVRQYILDSLSLEAAVGDLDTRDLVESMVKLEALAGQG